MGDRARISDNGKWCEFPCQCRAKDGIKAHPERVCRVAVANVANSKLWSRSGPDEAPTLSPSVDCQSCDYHGFIVAGVVQ